MKKSDQQQRELSLIEAAKPIWKKQPEGDDLGYLSRILVQVSLPHSDPGTELRVWTRSNGNAALVMHQGEKKDANGVFRPVGYPYGTIPRLIFLYLCREAIRTKSPIISLGDSLSDFLEAIGLDRTGGANGTITRLRMQLDRLFSASIKLQYDDPGVDYKKNGNFAEESVTFWDVKNPDQTSVFKSFVRLNKDLFDEIQQHPVPLDLRIIGELRKSPLALDLYSWLSHRVSYLKKNQRISWESISKQVGGEYKDLKDFRKKALGELKRIRMLWPKLQIDPARGGIILKPSEPSVPFLKSR